MNLPCICVHDLYFYLNCSACLITLSVQTAILDISNNTVRLLQGARDKWRSIAINSIYISKKMMTALIIFPPISFGNKYLEGNIGYYLSI